MALPEAERLSWLSGRHPALRRGAGWRRLAPVRVHRQRHDLLGARQTNLVDQLLAHDLGLEVGGVGVVDEMDQGHQIGHAPGAGFQARHLELDRVVAALVVDIGVHAIDIGLQEGARSGVELERMAVAVATHAQHPHPHIAGQRVGAEGGRQFAAPGGPEQLHLHQPVLGRHETLRAQQVGRVGGEDVGHAQFVAQHLDRRGQAGHPQFTVNLRMPGGTHQDVGRDGGEHNQPEQADHDPFQDFAHRKSSPVVMRDRLKRPAAAPL